MKARNQKAAVPMSGKHLAKKFPNMLALKRLRIILATTCLISFPLTANGSTYQNSIQDKNCPPMYIKYTPKANVTIEFYIFEMKRTSSGQPIEQSRTQLDLKSVLERSKVQVESYAMSSKATFLAQNSLKKPLGYCNGIDNDDEDKGSLMCINTSSGRSYKPGSYVGKVKVYNEEGGVGIRDFEGQFFCEVVEDNNGEAFCSDDFYGRTNGLLGAFTDKQGSKAELAIEKDGNWYGDRIWYSHGLWGWIQNKPYIFVSKIRRSGYVCQRPPPGPAL